MNERVKPIVSLTTLAALGLAITCDASAGPDRGAYRTKEQIRSCVAEIGKHANYGDASRVVHWVAKLEQRNLVEMEIKIDTTVYVDGKEKIAREYSASCVTGTMGDLVEFKIRPIGPDLGNAVALMAVTRNHE